MNGKRFPPTPIALHDRDVCLDWARGVYLWHRDNNAWETSDERFVVDFGLVFTNMLAYWKRYGLLPSADVKTIFNVTPTCAWYGKEYINEKPPALPTHLTTAYRELAFEVKHGKRVEREPETGEECPGKPKKDKKLSEK